MASGKVASGKVKDNAMMRMAATLLRGLARLLGRRTRRKVRMIVGFLPSRR